MRYQIRSLALVAVFAISCQIQTKRTEDSNIQVSQTLVDPKYSISQDRSELDQLRNSVPTEKKRINDEKALFAEWMGSVKMPPADVREKFDNLMRKKRETFNSDLTKIRDNFSKSEKKNRDDFLKDLEQQRVEFSRRKRERDERNDFFNELDDKRKNFFSEQREKRDEFESEIRDQRKNFEDYLKERSLFLNSELKVYTERWNQQNKNK